jgi:succinate dehydrogenase cytochrome b556 subunit
MGQVLAVNLRSPVAIASILHRLSGVIVFLLVAVLLWILDKSLSSPEGFDYVKNVVFGNILVRFIVWVFVAGLIFHFIALNIYLLTLVLLRNYKVVVLQLHFIDLVCDRYCRSFCMDYVLMKSATGLTGSGSRDWYIQRVSAVVLAAYTVLCLVGSYAIADSVMNNGLALC